MQILYDGIIEICAKLKVISDLLWEFPTNFKWYSDIPIVGSFSFAIILLLGSGIYFSIRLKFVQFRYFPKGIKTLFETTKKRDGISPLASFLLSSAMRVGPGNILGVTGAISIGGPGALFWMWISAIFSMATSFVESTLSQIFKQKDRQSYIGGMPFYGTKLLKNAAWVGVVLSSLYIVYAFLCLPAQGFNTISGINMLASSITNTDIPNDSVFNYVVFLIMIISIILMTFKGIKFVSKFTDFCVPIMAVLYLLTALLLIALHWNLIPWFFSAVFTGAFKPEAIFGGSLGVALIQGIKRGLMTNEAGQGTVSMPAAASNAKHPCEQGNVQSIGVFFDTVVICTPTAFIVILSQMWLKDTSWLSLGKLDQFIASCDSLSSSAGLNSNIVTIIVSLCYGLFALTTLAGFLTFSEMCAKRICKGRVFLTFIKLGCIFVVAFGVLANFAGMDLSSLWSLSDMANILMVYANIPLLYIGFKYVKKSFNHYKKTLNSKNPEDKFSGKTIGIKLDVWDKDK